MIINKKYIVLFWIIALVLFTFYCIFRIKYKLERYKNIPLPIPSSTLYDDKSKPYDIIAYIDNIQKQDKIIDMPECENIYDDNFKVQELGYNNCNNAYADYLNKNYDINNNYGQDKSLSDICPVTCKNHKYTFCLQTLINKFTDNSNILDNINKDMSKSINNRLIARSNALYNIQNSLNTFVYSKSQNDFNNNMLVNNQIPKFPYQKLGLIDDYYQDKYKLEGFNNQINNQHNIKNEQFTNVIDPYIESLYFGDFTTVGGQLLAFNNLTFSINYDTINNTDKSPLNTVPVSFVADFNTDKNAIGVSSMSFANKPVVFTIINNDLYLSYTVININLYKLMKNAIKIILGEKTILVQNDSNNVIEPLLTILGLNENSSLILVFDPYTSTENKSHNTYRLVNDNLDTILTLVKS